MTMFLLTFKCTTVQKSLIYEVLYSQFDCAFIKSCGNYNSDWAIVYEKDKKLYFVAETKDTGTTMVDFTNLSAYEQIKIKCGKAHFNEFDDLEYKVVNRVTQLVD